MEAGAGSEAEEEELPAALRSLREEVKRKSCVRELAFQTRVSDLLELDVKYSARVCPRSSVLWQLLHPSVRGSCFGFGFRVQGLGFRV